jgi:glucose dehydrogenase
VPMTYQGKNGKQYVAIVAAVGSSAKAAQGKGVFVFALP